jgi:hypothetical protein
MLEMPNVQFKCTIGMTKPVFQKMLEILQVAQNTPYKPIVNVLLSLAAFFSPTRSAAGRIRLNK